MADDDDRTVAANTKPWTPPKPTKPQSRPRPDISVSETKPTPEPKPDNSAPEVVEEPIDAVVGWLVVTSGPGRGHDFRLLSGMNSIGADADMAVTLDFGDRDIALRNHCRVTFDQRSRRFFLSPGDGRELIYGVDDQPILTAMPLATGQRFMAGKTTLMFVALCSEDFFWK